MSRDSKVKLTSSTSTFKKKKIYIQLHRNFSVISYCNPKQNTLINLHSEISQDRYRAIEFLATERVAINIGRFESFATSELENMSCPCWEQPRAPSRHAKPRSMNTRHFESFMHLQVVLARAFHTQHTWPCSRARARTCV